MRPRAEAGIADVRDLTERVRVAQNLQALLCAGCDAFEAMLTVIREHDHPGADLFLPMVRAGASAGNGRDHLLFAPSMPSRLSGNVGTAVWRSAQMTSEEAAIWLAGACHLVGARLAEAAGSAALPGDRQACMNAAECAHQINALLGAAP